MMTNYNNEHTTYENERKREGDIIVIYVLSFSSTNAYYPHFTTTIKFIVNYTDSF